MRIKTWPLVAAALFMACAAAAACPLCLGLFQQSKAQQLVAAPQAVLAVPTSDPGRFRVIQVIKGTRPTDGTVEGSYPRTGPGPGDVSPNENRPLLLVSDEPFPTWVILGVIDASRADWLRAVAAGKPTANMTADDWRARVALVLPHLHDAEPLSAELAYAELAAAPYAALRTARPRLDPAELRRSLADPELAARKPLYLLLLGIAGNSNDAAGLEQQLQAAWQAGDPTNVGLMIAADLELRGADRMAWVDSNYLVDPKRSPGEIKQALLALSVQGGADGAVPRERMIESYRTFMKAHPELAGYVAPDFAAWQYWDAVPEYLALIKANVPQQFPARLAMLDYLKRSPNAKSLGFSTKDPPDANAAQWNPAVPKR